mgnify:CR=1 FL=1
MDKTSGYWFSFKRGEWAKTEQGARHFEVSGLAYVGSLTKDQQMELDALISEYIESIKVTSNAKVSGAGTASAGLPGWQANGETE